MFSYTHLAFAQGGAKLSVGATIVKQDFLPIAGDMVGWNVTLAGRLGAGIWFFAPELTYLNTNVVPQEGMNPFESAPRIQTLKAPMGIGLKFKTAPFQKVFFKAGVVGSYVMIMDENSAFDWKTMKDTYGGYYGGLGYDFRWFTINYRYEKTLGDNIINIEDSAFAFHSVFLGINF